MNKNIHIIWKVFLILAIVCSLLTCIKFLESDNKNYGEGSSHIAFVLDVSKSMNVWDIAWISRLKAAKEKIYNIVSTHRWYSFALSIFAWESLRVLPFTTDISLYATFLNSIDSNNISVQGTEIDIALSDAIENFSYDMTGSIIILTDGDENNILISSEIKKKLQEKDLKVIVIWVGTIDWWYIPTGDIFAPYKIYNGELVIASLNISGLKKLTQSIGWEYYSIQEDISLWIHKSEIDSENISRFFYLSFLFYIFYLWSLWYSLYFKRSI